jgi:hypothetical protein
MPKVANRTRKSLGVLNKNKVELSEEQQAKLKEFERMMQSSRIKRALRWAKEQKMKK